MNGTVFALQSAKTAWNSRLLLTFHRSLPLSVHPPHLQVTNEDIKKLPKAQFRGESLLISDCSQEHKYMECIERLFKTEVLGVDSESKPSISAPALVQVASEDVCVLWRLRGAHRKHRWFIKQRFPPMLKKLLTSKNILKVGHDVNHDALLMMKHYRVNMHNYFDTLILVQKYLASLHMHSLKGLTATLRGQYLNKRYQMSNWEKVTLTDAQVNYASTDAWASLVVYKSLVKYASDQGVILEPAIDNFQSSRQGQKWLKASVAEKTGQVVSKVQQTNLTPHEDNTL